MSAKLEILHVPQSYLQLYALSRTHNGQSRSAAIVYGVVIHDTGALSDASDEV